jgi:glutamyl/glutaminyl-tRNA synthetase
LPKKNILFILKENFFVNKNQIVIFFMPISPKTSIRIQKLLDNLTLDFDKDKLSKSPARFNQAKLDWFNKEYFKMMNLTEFVLRYSQWKMTYHHQIILKNKIQNQELEKDYKTNFRTEEYIMFVDFKTQKVFACKDKYKVQDGQFFLLGRSTKKDQGGLQNLVKEITENLLKNTPNKAFKVDTKKILKVAEFKVWGKEKFIEDETEYDGKEFKIYCLPVRESDLQSFVLTENGENRKFEWYTLAEVIQTNDYLTYPIWNQFCIDNNLNILKPTNKILTNYLSLLLDKNRVTKFAEVGLDSGSINSWQKPSEEDLKWKKISLQESKKNLKEIWQAIKNIFYDKHTKLQEKFLLSILTDLLMNDINPNINSTQTNFDSVFWEVVSLWESEIKMWLEAGEKKPGDYLWPLRVALSGKKQSPSPFELLAILPKSEVDKRIKEVLS